MQYQNAAAFLCFLRHVRVLERSCQSSRLCVKYLLDRLWHKRMRRDVTLLSQKLHAPLCWSVVRRAQAQHTTQVPGLLLWHASNTLWVFLAAAVPPQVVRTGPLQRTVRTAVRVFPKQPMLLNIRLAWSFINDMAYLEAAHTVNTRMHLC